MCPKIRKSENKLFPELPARGHAGLQGSQNGSNPYGNLGQCAFVHLRGCGSLIDESV